MGGAAESCLRMQTVSRAAHRALHIDVNATASAPLEKAASSPARESGIGARKTPRKLRKAARAAGTKRAPSHPAYPH
mgnify:CR=1 FL=1